VVDSVQWAERAERPEKLEKPQEPQELQEPQESKSRRPFPSRVSSENRSPARSSSADIIVQKLQNGKILTFSLFLKRGYAGSLSATTSLDKWHMGM
jgi:hypothetical protein